MNDTADVNQSSCCMRKNATNLETLYDGVHANVALSAMYLGGYLGGFNLVCLGSFLSILMNSFYMWYIWEKEFTPVLYEDLDTSTESDTSESSENSENAQVDPNLSLKQREHGATVSKAMEEEDEIILNSRFQEVVEETRRRNEKRLEKNTIPRTPTNTSLDDLDEYADMPPLVSNDYSNAIPINRQCPACIHHYNNLIPTNTINYKIYEDISLNSPYISTFREIITASRGTALHGMNDVD
jgi:hypothetical protein